MTRIEQAMHFAIYPPSHPPQYNLQILAQRQALRAEIEQDMTKLETLRQREAVLRAVLVSQLKSFGYMVQRAEFKIESRQWADGNPALDTDFERMKEAAEALMDCVEEIKLSEDNIESKQGEFDDEALWKEDSNA